MNCMNSLTHGGKDSDLNNSGVQKLLLKAFRGDKEVEEGDFDRHLRRVVRVGQLAGHVESEIWVIRHHIVPNLDHLTATLHHKSTQFTMIH